MKVFSKKEYFCGILWFLMGSVVGVCNDALMKDLACQYDIFQVVCMRYFFATLSIVVRALFCRKRDFFRTRSLGIHSIRAIILLFAIVMYCSALKHLQMPVVTTLSFSIPFFSLLLARYIVGERVGHRVVFATVVGFVGVCVVLNPFSEKFEMLPSVCIIASSVLFALSDVINKKYVVNEGIQTMLFYTAAMVFALSLGPALHTWRTPSFAHVISFAVVGLGANILLYCILKSFEKVDVSAVAPFRYFELIFSCIASYCFFCKTPDVRTIVGAMIIIPCSIYAARAEARKAAGNVPS